LDIVIYHNPACGTSRNALELIRHVGIEPHVVQYLKTPPSRTMVAWLAERAGKPLRNLLREKGTPFAELGLGDPGLTDDQLSMRSRPIRSCSIARSSSVRSASACADRPRPFWTSCPPMISSPSPRRTARSSSTPPASG